MQGSNLPGAGQSRVPKPLGESSIITRRGERGKTPAGGTEGSGGASCEFIIPRAGALVKGFLKKFWVGPSERWRAVRPNVFRCAAIINDHGRARALLLKTIYYILYSFLYIEFVVIFFSASLS